MGYFKIITAILIWSSLGIFVRKIDLPNIGIIFYPAVIAGSIQLLSLFSTGQIKGAVKVNNNPQNIFFLILIPIFFIANTLLFFYAFRNTTIANAVLTHYTAPIFVALLAPVFLHEKILKKAWYAIILSSIGLWFILGMPISGGTLSFSDSERLGIIAGVLSGLAYALLIIMIRQIASKFSTLFIICMQNCLVVLILLPFVYTIPLTVQSLPYMLTLGVVHSTFAPFLYVQGFHSVKANEAAILGYLEPVGAILLAMIFLHELPGFRALLGGALILLSGYMIVNSRGK
jgi:drug/metabolite transporter (DMT)-like permease